MDDNRWMLLMHTEDVELTAEEKRDGWHFCPDWDGLLVGPEMDEYESCRCKEVP
jgi:hypothetical protein